MQNDFRWFISYISTDIKYYNSRAKCAIIFRWFYCDNIRQIVQQRLNTGVGVGHTEYEPNSMNRIRLWSSNLDMVNKMILKMFGLVTASCNVRSGKVGALLNTFVVFSFCKRKSRITNASQKQRDH